MKKLALGISSGIIYIGISMTIALLTAPIYLIYLSKEAFGTFYLLNNIVIWAGLLNGGLRAGFKLKLASGEAKGENSDALINTVFLTQLFTALLILAAGITFSLFIPDIFTIESLDSSEVTTTFQILTVSFGFTLLSNSFAAFLSVHNKDSITYTIRSGLIVFQALLSVCFLYSGFGVMGLALAALIGEGILLSFLFFNIRRINPSLFKLRLYNSAHLKELFSVGKWFMAGFLAQLLIRHTDLIIISNIEGIAIVAAFILTSKLYILLLAFLQMILKVSLPQLTKAIQKNRQQEKTEDPSLLLLKFSSGFILIGGSIVFAVNEYFINWWVGESFFLGESANMIMFLTFIFTSLTLTVRTILTAGFELKKQKLSALVEGILHVSLSAILGKFFGIHGFLIGVQFSSIVALSLSLLHLSFVIKDSQEIKKGVLSLTGFIAASILTICQVIIYPTILIMTFSILLLCGIFLFLFIKDLKFLKESIFNS